MKPERALAILDAAYAQDLDDERWMRQLVEAIRPVFDLGLGMAGYFVELGGPGEYRGYGYVGAGELDVAGVTQTLLERAGPEFMRQAHLLGPYATTEADAFASVVDAPAGLGVMDHFQGGAAAGVMAINPDGKGIAFGTYAPKGARAERSREQEAAFWDRVVPHLVTAVRLRRLLAQAPSSPEAIFDPGGALLHAEGAAKTAESREQLRTAVVRVDRAHAEARANEAMELWRCMVRRRWTLVDRFERDGRRYVVAYPNEAEVDVVDARLSEREQVVAAAAAMGHANKLIADELDLAESTVSTHLSRVARKLGVESRTELVRTLRNRRR